MIFYLIRHKATGEFMPQLKNKGYTHWNPNKDIQLSTKKLTGCPRLFETKRKAMTAISSWNSMPNATQGFRQTYWGEDDYDFDIKNDGRKKDDLEVVIVELIVK